MGMKMVSLAKIVMREIIVISIALSCLFTLAYILLRPYLLRIFTDD